MSDEGAKRIVRLLVARGVESGGEVANATIWDWAVQAGLGALDGALISAGKLGWIDKGPRPGTTKLTNAGFAAAKE